MKKSKTQDVPKKQWQKPDFYLLDSAHDINNFKTVNGFHENTVHLSYVVALAGNFWIKASKHGNTAFSALINQTSAALS